MQLHMKYLSLAYNKNKLKYLGKEIINDISMCKFEDYSLEFCVTQMDNILRVLMLSHLNIGEKNERYMKGKNIVGRSNNFH